MVWIKKEIKSDHDYSVNRNLIPVMLIITIVIFVYVADEKGTFQSISLITGYPKSNMGVGSIAPTMGISQTYSGSLNIQMHHRDSLDVSEDRLEGKEVVTTFYKRLSDGRYVTLGSGNDAMVIVEGRDKKLYFTIHPLKGNDLFISPNMIAHTEINPRVLDFEYLDVTGDNIPEWIFTFDITGLPHQPYMTYPIIALFSMTYDEGEMVLNSPSDFEVYAGSSLNNIKWELYVPEKKAVAVNKVELIIDDPDSSKISLKDSWVKIPQIDNLELTEMDQMMTSNKMIYSYEFGKDLSGTDYVSTQRNSNPSHDMTVRLHTYLEEGDELGVTLKVTSISPDQGYTTVSDTVKLIPTSGGDEIEEISWIGK